MTAKLGWADYLVMAIMLVISAGIGVYYRFTGGRQKTSDEYFIANRSMSILPVGIALMASFMSAITLLGVSAENYTYGTQFVVINISYGIGTPIAAYGFLPVFFKLQATSAYEYLEKRFGMGARLVTSFVYWIQLLLYTGVVLYAPALALEATTSLSKTGSIIVIGLVCAFYSSIGGIKAVLITDVFQSVLMFVAVFAIITTAAIDVGGLSEIWRIAGEGGRLEFDNISPDPTERHTYWSLVIGGLFTFLSLYGVNQVQVQRMLTVKSLKAAQTALWLNWPILMLLSFSTCFAGLSIYSKYYKCDPILEGRISSTDMLMPLYVMDTMSSIPGLPGLFVAGIFSAGLSTVSAALNSLSAVTLEDYIKPAYRKCSGKEFSLAKSTIFGKSLAFAFGLICIALAFLAQFLGGILQASLTIFGVVGGPLLGMFTLGMFTESATQRGAVTGVLTALAFTLWIGFGTPRPPAPKLPTTIDGCASKLAQFTNLTAEEAMATAATLVPAALRADDPTNYFYLYRISYMWYSLIGFLVTFIVGLLVSNVARIILKEEQDDLDPDLFIPWLANRIRARRSIASINKLTEQYNAPSKYNFPAGGRESPAEIKNTEF
ncbi:putative sodium-dependent multivitamin transporter [Athalia rosae]|uniref:putative sodium-dependent multivitamin transporter n=1 Tax=Athalia rosae TaxID=37344 RepID=UPI0020341A61|nr:putative sodium-dependent multivitamin transporter [Athalia rosae]XP_012261195.2 putative sodium-dependent multivitamin transporter [Athalia rosae]XP_012261198.2 putative sodium-dependent multivitamin transporter [Athalia rosae]XP_048516346.1 putative sodium-dependent multivitamin transporter [Athalia rosae]XP_048516347.1 putative sodium-dependent multivitamin transporter [Athalia rosae]